MTLRRLRRQESGAFAGIVLGRFATRLNRLIYARFQRFVSAQGDKGMAVVFFLATLVGLGVAVPAAMHIVPHLSYFFAPFFFLYLGTGFFIFNLGVMRLIFATFFFWVRVLSAVVSCVCLCIIFDDATVCIALTLFILQTVVAAGDAFAGDFGIFRVCFLAQLASALLAMLVGLFFDLVLFTYATVVVTSSFDYALSQLARDLLLGTLFVTLFDL